MLDTNILVSALLFGGRLRRIAELVASGVLIPCFTTSTFQEFEEVCLRPKFARLFGLEGLSPEDLDGAIAEQSVILKDPDTIPTILTDWPDNFILACAVAADASCIVSGDKALRRLREFRGIPILSAQEFLRTIHHA